MYYKTAQAAEIVGMESWQVQSYAKQGFVEPAVAPHGAGSRRAYDFMALVKLAILNRLNRDGFDLRTIRPIFSSLFDLPLGGKELDSAAERARVGEWFRDRVLLTCDRFATRKLVKRERLAAALGDLMCARESLYIVDLGRTVDALLSNVEADSGGSEE